MKLIIALLAAAGLSGCVAYGVPYSAEVQYSTGSPYYGGSYYGGPYVVEQQPIYIQRGYHRDHRGGRDRDRDGVPNRYDRDRDGDGVPNRHDNRPNNPRRH